MDWVSFQSTHSDPGQFRPRPKPYPNQNNNLSSSESAVSDTENIDPELQNLYPIEQPHSQRPTAHHPSKKTLYPCPFDTRGCSEKYATVQTRKVHLNRKKTNPDLIHQEGDELWMDPQVIKMYKVSSFSQCLYVVNKLI